METNDPPYFCLVLHAYQPPYPIQQKHIVERIVKKCYLPVSEMLLDNPDYRITLNISASLTEMLVEYPRVLENLKTLVKRNQIELLGSAAYHPLLPLIESEERKYQVDLNSEINKKLIHEEDPQGFFPPELAVTSEVIQWIADEGFSYCLVPSCLFDDIEKSPWRVRLPRGKSIAILARNNDLSNAIAFNRYPSTVNFIEHMNYIGETLEIKNAIAAMDIETFGEHQKDYYKFLEEILALFPTKTTFEVIKNSEALEIPLSSLKSGSWSTEIEDLDNNIPFPLWDDPENGLHQLQLAHLYTLQEASKLADKSSDGFERDRLLVAKAMQSCQFWWASRGHWGPDIIRKAFNLQIQGLKSLQNHISEKESRLKYDILINLSRWLEKRLSKCLETLEKKRL